MAAWCKRGPYDAQLAQLGRLSHSLGLPLLGPDSSATSLAPWLVAVALDLMLLG